MTRVPRIRRLNRARIRVTVDESRASPWTEAGKYSLRLAIRRVSLPRNRSLRHPVKFRGSRDLERILLFSLGIPLRRDSVLIETICMDICITDSIMNFKYVEKRSISDDLDILYSSQRRNLGLAESTRILFSVETLFILESYLYRIYIWNNEKPVRSLYNPNPPSYCSHRHGKNRCRRSGVKITSTSRRFICPPPPPTNRVNSRIRHPSVGSQKARCLQAHLARPRDNPKVAVIRGNSYASKTEEEGNIVPDRRA